jgi:hypothetical protein
MDNSSPGRLTVSADDLQRVEGKVDKCLEAIERLVLIDERQVVQGQRMGQIEQRCAVMESQQQVQAEKLWEALKTVERAAIEANHLTRQKLDKWINFGMGAWSLAVTAFAIFQAFHK